MEERWIPVSLAMEGPLDSLWILALLTAVGAFLVTYLAYRGWLAVKRGASRAVNRVRGGNAGTDAPRIGEPPGANTESSAPEGSRAPAASVPRSRAPPGDDGWDDEAFAAQPAPSGTSAKTPDAGNGAPAKRNGGRGVEMDGQRIHAPRERPGGRAPESGSRQLTATAPPKTNGGGGHAPAWEEKKKQMALNDWEGLVQEVMSQESVLARSRGRLSKRRSLQSLLASIRDRDLLYERGERIGRAIYAESYRELGDRLERNRVCEEAVFRKSPGDGMEIRLIGTAMAREAPVIGTCVCFMEAGLIAGAMSNMEDTPHEVREAKCVVKGDPFCEFRATRKEPEEKSWIDDPSALTDDGGDVN